jgi:hypothetical protein
MLSVRVYLRTGVLGVGGRKDSSRTHTLDHRACHYYRYTDKADPLIFWLTGAPYKVQVSRTVVVPPPLLHDFPSKRAQSSQNLGCFLESSPSSMHQSPLNITSFSLRATYTGTECLLLSRFFKVIPPDLLLMQ